MKPAKIGDDRIALAAEIACFLEVSAEKPGNVTATKNFPDLRFDHFLLGGAVIGNVLRKSLRENVGRIIYQMSSDAIDLCGTNVNLGIILLFVPLAKILKNHGRLTKGGALKVLHKLTVKDAELVFSAIRKIKPAGMGKLNRHDFWMKPKISLFRAMELAKSRDSVASEYATGFSIVRTISYPYFRELIRSGLHVKSSIIQTFLYLMSRIPDTFIIRKTDKYKAEKISKEAAAILKVGGVQTKKGLRKIMDFDRKLRTPNHELNPGTTADLIAATLFVYLVQNGFNFLKGSIK